jgi:hypothetical protein
MFVLMVAVLPPLLSDQPPEVPKRAGCGDRFHYFRGSSGHRYLFSAICADDLGDFRSAVVIFASRVASGRLSAHWISALDRSGQPTSGNRRWPPQSPGSVILVHLLSASEAERSDIVADLSGLPAVLAA